MARTIQGRLRSVRPTIPAAIQPKKDQLDAEQQQRDHNNRHDHHREQHERGCTEVIEAAEIGDGEDCFRNVPRMGFPIRTLRHRGIRRLLQRRPTRHFCPNGVATERAPMRTFISRRF